MNSYFAAPPTLGGPTHDGALENTRYHNGVICRKLVRSPGGFVRYITASFVLTGQQRGSGKIRVWYLRDDSVGDDSMTLNTFATFLRPGERADYNIFKDTPFNQVLRGGEVLAYFDIPFSAPIQGDGLFSVVLDFQSLDDNETMLAGIELLLH
ncbi:MAG: hypothetical protein ACFFCX_10610 [Candidatus Sifarchaeia archaeon]